MAAQGRRGGAAVEAGFARDGGVRGGVAAGGASAVRGAFKVLHCCAAAGAAALPGMVLDSGFGCLFTD